MDLTKVSYDAPLEEDDTEPDADLDDEEAVAGDYAEDEEAAISLAIGSDDPDRIESFRDAVKACLRNMGNSGPVV